MKNNRKRYHIELIFTGDNPYGIASKTVGRSNDLNYALNRQLLLSAEWGAEAYIRVFDMKDEIIVSIRYNIDPVSLNKTQKMEMERKRDKNG